MKILNLKSIIYKSFHTLNSVCRNVQKREEGVSLFSICGSIVLGLQHLLKPQYSVVHL